MDIMEMMGIRVVYVCLECGWNEELATPEKPKCDCVTKGEPND
jgi:hypothetical protein